MMRTKICMVVEGRGCNVLSSNEATQNVGSSVACYCVKRRLPMTGDSPWRSCSTW